MEQDWQSMGLPWRSGPVTKKPMIPGGPGFIPSQGTRSHMPQGRSCVWQQGTHVPPTTTQHSQINE